MRKLIFAIHTTIDGCVDHTKQLVDTEKMEYFTQLTREADLQLYGRKTYELMVPYWPNVAKDPSSTKTELDFAKAFEALHKVVFSRTLKSAEDKNTRIIGTDLRDEVLKLKQEPGNYIIVGGVDVASQVIELGLVDEYLFVVSPVLAGKGRRLMDGANLKEKLKLQFVDSKTFQSGSVALRYRKGSE
jgi:dihydrofolate reductase